MDSETRKAIQTLCGKLGHEWVIHRLTSPIRSNLKELRCKICDINKEYAR